MLEVWKRTSSKKKIKCGSNTTILLHFAENRACHSKAIGSIPLESNFFALLKFVYNTPFSFLMLTRNNKSLNYFLLHRTYMMKILCCMYSMWLRLYTLRRTKGFCHFAPCATSFIFRTWMFISSSSPDGNCSHTFWSLIPQTDISSSLCDLPCIPAKKKLQYSAFKYTLSLIFPHISTNYSLTYCLPAKFLNCYAVKHFSRDLCINTKSPDLAQQLGTLAVEYLTMNISSISRPCIANT